MSLFELIKLSRKALQIEPEEELVYLFGKKLKEIDYMKIKKPKYSGFFFRSLWFFGFILYNFNFKRARIEQKPLLIFASTDNQFNSLKPTITALSNQQVDYELLLGRVLAKKKILNFSRGHLVTFGFKELILAVMFYFRNGIPLYFKFKKQNRYVESESYFNKFCQAYVFVPYFLNVLLQAKPNLVLMSNDHNLNNRSFRLAAEVLGIKTLYVQHASVSDLFPPLEFDYALLDGRIAHETYIRCYEYQKGTNPRIEKNLAKCQVILSGQKKQIVSEAIVGNLNKDCLGLAVNGGDDFYCVQTLLDKLAEMKVQCIIRTHPNQGPIFLDQLKNYMKGKDWLTWSNSREEDLVDFFPKINALIAGNTSLHLEAALAGIPTFYLEMSDEVHRPDYYGYVKNGISTKLEQDFTFDELRLAIENADSIKRHQAIKNYSETYDTKWQNREGELSALVIESIIKNKSLDTVFKQEEPFAYQSVLSISEDV